MGRKISAALWYAVAVYSSVRIDLILELGLGGREQGCLDGQQMSEGVRMVAL